MKPHLFMCSKPLKYFPFFSAIHFLINYFCSQVSEMHSGDLNLKKITTEIVNYAISKQ